MSESYTRELGGLGWQGGIMLFVDFLPLSFVFPNFLLLFLFSFFLILIE